MKPSRIRELASRYAAGEISLDEYRAQRRKLIDGVAAGLLKLEYGELSIARDKHSNLRWFSGIALLLTAIGIGIFVWMEHTHRVGQINTQTRIMPESGPGLVRTFIETNDWTDASLMQFLQHWKALSSREQKAAYNSYMYPRLLSQLREQIASQQAVVDLAAGDNHASDPARVHLAHLLQLSETLGVEPGE
ncbi:MAG TPA: SHOCT domain-containing protein [Gammaproteobacteria bacterium]|nr:SHOCT domain-containing protein [Gammaproteobacteria bacterium]